MTGAPLKIIFAGTPFFAATALDALLGQHFNVIAVLTQPDRPAGRGLKLAASPVKRLALEHGLPVHQPTSLKSEQAQQMLASYAADVMVVAAYGLLLPSAVLQLPRFGCLNIHASLLPRWRGAAPIQRAILAGDSETGITIMQMDEGLDTGAVLLKKSCVITVDDTSASLLDKLAILGAETIIEALRSIEYLRVRSEPQDSAQTSYAAKLNKDEGKINWMGNAIQIARAVRAYNPFPGAVATFNSIPIKIWQAHVCSGRAGVPGSVLAVEKGGIIVGCGSGAICLEVLQRPNAKAMSAAQFVQGFAIHPGDHF